jgi:hypothetical protein
MESWVGDKSACCASKKNILGMNQIYTPVTIMTELFQFVIRSSVIYKTHTFMCAEHESQDDTNMASFQ